MEYPIFRLEGVVKTKEDFEDFEGPLSLILLLLAKDKIEIRDISISLILDQYLGYLDEMAELNLDIASEFVAMASHLTYIKTKMLLSGNEEISELEQLISSLEQLQNGDIYTQISAAAQSLAQMYTRGAGMMAKPPEYIQSDDFPQYNHSSGDIINALLRVVGRENLKMISANTRTPVFPARIVYSISEKTTEILDRLKLYGQVSLMTLFYESKSRAELVAALVAILELCKLGRLFLLGADNDFMLTYKG